MLAPDLKDYLGDFDRKRIVLAQAGGATYRGITLALNMVVEGSEAPGAHYPDGKSPYRAFSLSRFADAPAIVARGVTIGRVDLIKYVANKMGGVHYDESRKTTDHAYKALDSLPEQIVWDDGRNFDLRYYEMLAIGQLMVAAPDIETWLAE